MEDNKTVRPPVNKLRGTLIQILCSPEFENANLQDKTGILEVFIKSLSGGLNIIFDNGKDDDVMGGWEHLSMGVFENGEIKINIYSEVSSNKKQRRFRIKTKYNNK